MEILNLRNDSFRKVSTPKIDHSFPWEKKGENIRDAMQINRNGVKSAEKDYNASDQKCAIN